MRRTFLTLFVFCACLAASAAGAASERTAVYMLPLAAVSFWLFAIQRGQTTGFEQTVCRWGIWIVAIAAILRDMCLSGQLVALYQRMISTTSSPLFCSIPR